MERITVDNLSKKFNIGFKKNQTALGQFIHIISGSGRESKKTLEVLEGISFSVKPGEVLGIIGNNGSGKSTLLRIIAGIYKADGGRLSLNGRVIPIIGLGIGMNGRLTARDNISLVSSLFGMGQKDIKNKFDSIVKFSGLEEFVETKLYQFSSGMLQRLAFSIAIHCKPDILLLDEVFEVGDEDFRNKSAGKIKDLVKEGSCVIFVSHELEKMEKYCNRIIWLDKGKIKEIGEPKNVIESYKRD